MIHYDAVCCWQPIHYAVYTNLYELLCIACCACSHGLYKYTVLGNGVSIYCVDYSLHRPLSGTRYTQMHILYVKYTCWRSIHRSFYVYVKSYEPHTIFNPATHSMPGHGYISVAGGGKGAVALTHVGIMHAYTGLLRIFTHK